MPADPDLAIELRNVERARAGDHDAFVALYRQHAPMAWRLALALTADAELASDAVTSAFARTLAPLAPGTVRSEAPFQLRLLTATRHAVLDAGTSSPSYVAAVGAPPAEPSRPAAEAMQSFHHLPERWRTILWLVVVEGIGTAEAAAILEVRSGEAEELAARADAGLRTQWVRDRKAAGEADPVAPEHLDRMLQTVLPLPLGLFDITDARWQATRRPAVGPIGLVLPGGRPLPRWAERGLLASTAALIALGITSALAVDRDPDGRRARGEKLASADPPTTLDAGTPPEPQAYLDGEDGVRTEPTDEMRARRAATSTTLAATITAAAIGAATAAPPSTTSAPAGSATAPIPASSPLQATAALGHTLGIALGDCTGVELAGQVVGCAPPVGDDPVTLDVSGTLGG